GRPTSGRYRRPRKLPDLGNTAEWPQPVAAEGQSQSKGRLKGEMLRRFGKGSSRAQVVAITNHRVVPTMTVAAARLAFLLDIRDFAAGRELAIASDDAPAGESGEPKKSNETHKTLKRTAINA